MTRSDTGMLHASEGLCHYFSGKKLYGDDFTLDEIKEWLKDEQEGYADLGARDTYNYTYVYHELNIRHGFAYLGRRRFRHVLGLGSAYGDEFLPVIQQIDRVTIVDPSDAFSDHSEIRGVPCQYCKPHADGTIPFQEGTFDLITSLSVMHHIPNVSKVMKECARCLAPDGTMLLREPITSMGDWRKPRPGLTKRERGIPLKLLLEIIEAAGLTIRRKRLCRFPLVPRLANRIGIAAYNSATATAADELLCWLFSWNIKYHRESILTKLGPTAVYFVLGRERVVAKPSTG